MSFSIPGAIATGLVGGKLFGRKKRSGISERNIFPQVPLLLALGGLVPDLQETIRGILPDVFRNLNFIDPLEFGPFGGIGRQFSTARAAGRTALTRRGLQGSGAESALSRDLSLQEAEANRQAITALLQNLTTGIVGAQNPEFAAKRLDIQQQLVPDPLFQLLGQLAGAAGNIGAAAAIP